LAEVVPACVTGEKDASGRLKAILSIKALTHHFWLLLSQPLSNEQQALITTLTDRVSSLDERLTAPGSKRNKQCLMSL